MRNNLANNAQRQCETGPVYTEVLSNSAGTIEVKKYHTVRIRAVAGGTITLDGVLACTLKADEIILMNVGGGTPGGKETVTVVASAAVYLQVGSESDRTT